MQVTWQQQMVSQIIVVINGLGSYKRTFILPVTAATQKSIADTAGMSYMSLGQSMAMQLGPDCRLPRGPSKRLSQ